MRPTTEVALCVGKDCRKRDEHERLRRELQRTDAEVIEVACIGVCAGPIVALEPRSTNPTVLKKLRSKRLRRDVAKALRSGRLAGNLKDQRITGKRHQKVTRRLQRRLDRATRIKAA